MVRAKVFELWRKIWDMAYPRPQPKVRSLLFRIGKNSYPVSVPQGVSPRNTSFTGCGAEEFVSILLDRGQSPQSATRPSRVDFPHTFTCALLTTKHLRAGSCRPRYRPRTRSEDRRAGSGPTAPPQRIRRLFGARKNSNRFPPAAPNRCQNSATRASRCRESRSEEHTSE